MKLYETTFILNPQADNSTLDQQVKAITDLITTNGGKIVAEDRMGTRRLAYEIKRLTQGYYTSLLFEAPPQVPSIMERFFRLDDAYVRHLTILFEGDPDAVKERQEAMAQALEAQDRRRRSEHGRRDNRGGRYQGHGESRPRDHATPKPEAVPAAETKAETAPPSPEATAEPAAEPAPPADPSPAPSEAPSATTEAESKPIVSEPVPAEPEPPETEEEEL